MFGIKFFVFVIMTLMALMTAQVTVASPFVDKNSKPPSNPKPSGPIISTPPFNPNARSVWG